MKIINKRQIEGNKEITRLAYAQFGKKNFLEGLAESYGSFSFNQYNTSFFTWLGCKLPQQVEPILQLLNGDIKGKKILDLGCGSSLETYEAKEFDPKMYEPWLCRALFDAGANPIGIDVGNLDFEMFEHYRVDLLSQNSLDFFENNSIDLAHADLLYDSPTLEQMSGCSRLRDTLLPQLERVVKREGYFLE